jgi:hypothetical protein|tara:strand:- start:3 stop:482 length:480 start_codon:yes stop_codon:yes gene_type:complete
MIDYKKVELDFLDSAPIKISLTADLNIAPAALFKQFEDPHWWDWATIKSVVWETEKPYGRGTTRTVDIAGQGRVQEYFLLWEQDQRMSFRFEQGEMKLVSALVEDYQVQALAEGRSRLTWNIAMQLRGFIKILTPVLSGVMKKQFSGMLDNLVTTVNGK